MRQCWLLGLVTATLVVSSCGPIGDPTYEEMMEFERGFNRTDLGVSLVGLPATVAAGTSLDFTIRTENNGPNPNNGLRVTIAVSDGIKVVPDQDCTDAGDLMECVLFRLSGPGVAGQESVWELGLTLEVGADHPDLHGANLTIEVTLDNLVGEDPALQNNTASAWVKVLR